MLPSTAMPWSIGGAVAVFSALEKAAHRAGYLIAIYGSVVRTGEGSDLDLIAVPMRQQTSADELIARLCMALPLTETGERYHGTMHTLAVGLRMAASDRVIDLQIREVSHTTLTPMRLFGL